MFKEYLINDFELTYDGMYFIKWEGHSLRVFLELSKILKMIQLEGLSLNDIELSLKKNDSIHFKKVTMFAYVEDESGRLYFKTSEYSENYFDENITLFEVDLKE